MKVFLLSRYGPLGASSRIRSYQYLPYLKAHGIDVTVSPLLGNDYLRKFYSGRVNHRNARLAPYSQRLIKLLKSRRFDLLWIEKELFPWLPSWCEMLIARLGIPYIVDYDDAIFHSYDTHSNIFVRKFLGNKIDTVMRNAALVTAGNEYLMARAEKAGARRVEYLPTVIDLKRYSVKDNTKNSVFTIGWIGSPMTVKYLEMIRPVFSEWDKKNNACLVIIGDDSFKLDGINVEYRSWSHESEVSDIQTFDVGIMPLPNNLWEKGKCGYKLIQYMACGKPVIASPVGVNSKIVEHGVNGFLASSKKEWIESLELLYADPERRYEMGKEGRRKVENNYCVQITAPRLLDLMSSCVS
ncbi:MAG: glycosyltransferase family 1 protein [Deltaproteobacteria bacterium]|nr:MAG: glycosyltransferase family 1 protein [Deltaproteobacteria bacterium]